MANLAVEEINWDQTQLITLHVGILDDAGNAKGSATGFLYKFELPDTKRVLALVTNRHVLSSAHSLRVRFRHRRRCDGSGAVQAVTEQTISNLAGRCLLHPNQKVDLGCVILTDVVNKLESESGQIHYVMLNKETIPTESMLRNLSPFQEVFMFGYPVGIADLELLSPLVRRGILSSPPGIDYLRPYTGVVDMACFPGSSGSPIMMLRDQRSPNPDVDPANTYLIGVLYAGPVYSSEGTVEIVEIPTSITGKATYSQMTHLGFYVHARAILELQAAMVAFCSVVDAAIEAGTLAAPSN